MKAIYFSVSPRYTSGSPAQVDEDTAQRVAKQELAAYHRTLEGVYGEDAKQRAIKDGCDWIAYEWNEKGKNVVRVDLITGAERIIPTATLSNVVAVDSRTDPRYREKVALLIRHGFPVSFWMEKRQDESYQIATVPPSLKAEVAKSLEFFL